MDQGSDINIMNESVADKVGLKRMNCSLKAEGFNNVMTSLKEKVDFTFRINNKSKNITAYIFSNKYFDVIIGEKSLEDFGIYLTGDVLRINKITVKKTNILIYDMEDVKRHFQQVYLKTGVSL